MIESLSRKFKNPVSAIALFLLACTLVWIAVSYRGSDELSIGSKAPGFSLPRIGNPGARASLSDVAGGKVVVLLFWSYLCTSCRKELVAVSASLDRFEVIPAEVVGIYISRGKRREAGLLIERSGVDFVNLEGDAGTAERYKVSTLPAACIVDAKGNVCYTETGYDGVDRLLGEARRCAGK